MEEITNEQKLYVLLKHKKSRTRYEDFQMKLIMFFNYIGDSWEGDAYALCEREGRIAGDEPNEEQLKVFKTRGYFHKIYPPYTQVNEVYLRALWKKAPSNPKNWWRILRFWEMLGAIAAITSLILSII